MGNDPRYPLSSVDNALELLLLLQRRGELGVSESARALGIAKSTAHRLLTMLTFHGFARQDPDHRYRPGDVLDRESSPARDRGLERLLHPYLEQIAHVTGETANAQVMSGRLVRIIDCVQGTEPLCVGDRRGITFRGEAASGGLALLSLMSREEIAGLYLDDSEVRLPRLFTVLSRVRRQGYALNLGSTEPHIRAVGVAVRDRTGTGVAALVTSVPSTRFGAEHRVHLAEMLRRIASRVQAELSALQPV